jgi:hypothetical protein
MKTKNYLIKASKKAYRLALNKKFLNPECDINRDSANNKIFNLLESGNPCMISRFGTVELNCVNNYLCIISEKNVFKKIYEYITDNTHAPWWDEEHFSAMKINAGVFPPGKDTSERFARRYLKDIPEIDVLGSFQYYEKFMPLKDEVQKVQLETLYPFFVEKPWTRALKNKKVLVVHPFDYSIQEQYKKRKLLFSNEDVLPDYDLITFRAVQSAAGSSVPFVDWFEALEYMQEKISNIDFDICILGCGAYGLPLAAYIKRLGKQAIHMGGGTQLLFGIKGRRWVDQYKGYWNYRPGQNIDINYAKIFNEHWVFPDTSERPNESTKVENACYW